MKNNSKNNKKLIQKSLSELSHLSIHALYDLISFHNEGIKRIGQEIDARIKKDKETK